MWKSRAAGSVLVESSSAQDGRGDSFFSALCGSGCEPDGCVDLAPTGGLAEAMAVSSSSSASAPGFVYNLEEGESFTPKCDEFITDNICGTQEYRDPSSARQPRERRAECEEHDVEEEDIALAFATALDADADDAARIAHKCAPPLASSDPSGCGAQQQQPQQPQQQQQQQQQPQQHVVVFETAPASEPDERAPPPAKGFTRVGASSSWWRKVDSTTSEGGDGIDTPDHSRTAS